MAKRRKRIFTPEERRAWQERHEETQRMVAERIAYHEAKAREEEEERAKRAG
jgi:hypothetical protein